MMKVLWCTNTPCSAIEILTGQNEYGGGWLSSLSNSLKESSEIDLHVAFYWSTDMDPFVYNGITYHPIKRGSSKNRLSRYFSRFVRQFSLYEDRKEVGRLYRIIAEVNPDVIHIHGSEENFGLVANRVVNTPIVISIQGLLLPYYEKLYSGLPKQMVKRFDSKFKKLIFDGYSASDRRFKLKAHREMVILSNINNVVGRTAWDRDCTLAINPQRRYFVCDELLRSPFTEFEWRPHSHSRKVITTIISNGIFKGLEQVYSTARILSKNSVEYEWNVIGISSGQDEDILVRKITRISPDSINVKLLGRKNADEIVTIFKESDLYVQVSHIENSPNSLCEAMFVGLPVIASNVGGTSSMMEDGIEGILVQDGDPYRLAGSIMNLFDNYESAIQMGAKARIRAMERHSPKNVVNQLLSIYKELVNE